MVRLWLELLSLLLVKDLVMVLGFQGKHRMEKSLVFKSPAQRSNRDISNHISPSGGVQPRQEGGDLRPHLQLPQGFDMSTGQQQEDGQFCVFKKLSLEGIEKVPVQQCIHRVDTQCYSSYVTEYTPTTEVGLTQIFSSKYFLNICPGVVQ